MEQQSSLHKPDFRNTMSNRIENNGALLTSLVVVWGETLKI